MIIPEPTAESNQAQRENTLSPSGAACPSHSPHGQCTAYWAAPDRTEDSPEERSRGDTPEETAYPDQRHLLPITLSFN